MSKKPQLIDMPGLGPKLEEKLQEAGIKTILNLSRAKADKLAEKVDGLSESRAADLIALAQEMIAESAPKKKKAEAKPEKKATKKKAEPKAKTAKKEEKPKAEKKVKKPKAQAKPTKAKKKKKVKEKPEIPVRFKNVDQRLLRIARNKKRRMPMFRADQAHRWKRVSNRWRKIRGIDSYARQKKKGRIAMVSPGYRTPKAIRYLHPSLYIEVPVQRPADLEGLNADIHAVRIGATVGSRKRQAIIAAAEVKDLRVLNPGAIEEIGEDVLFSDLDLEEE